MKINVIQPWHDKAEVHFYLIVGLLDLSLSPMIDEEFTFDCENMHKVLFYATPSLF